MVKSHLKHSRIRKFDLELTFDLKIVGFPILWCHMQILFKFQVNRMKNDDFRNLTSKITGGWIQGPGVQILFKFQFNRMKIEDFRNTTLVVTFGLCSPFDLKNNSLLPDDKLYHVVKIGLKLWPVGDRQTDKQTDKPVGGHGSPSIRWPLTPDLS